MVMIDLVHEKKSLGVISVTQITETSLMHQCLLPGRDAFNQVRVLWPNSAATCRPRDRNHDSKKK